MHLIDRINDKEENALIELMNMYGDYLLRTAYLLLEDHQLAEEVVQDTFIIAFEKGHQLGDPDKLKSWLTTIVINRCRSQMRKWSWKNIVPAFDWVKEEAYNQTPEVELLAVIDNQNVSKAIQTLDYKYREVITLFYFNELKISEIACQIKTKETTIKSRLKRGRMLLGKILEKGEGVVEAGERKIKKST
ncbi:RNA polymerase sigma factor [Ferdinandcohnia quinoae]|uniref:RNA polymerase sigma factor n=1 Tax=Fredinandcohnia quinoae TaxID=2918902 RepID=A0AAW5ED65_9BACI|nr:sigma-70 family RNA polymerase sigma factor [Fredinandcohnia sp. SECRCQ15]MCH1627386.1 sigma-70 family RNA polymerase sigma factor [Fredinandcohnia sp. SECRCQ15]